LLAAIKSGDRPQVDEASKQLRAACENSLPHEKPVGWLEENVEVMFVAIVIALGLRAYYLQPFRIPTGSMQPTLNGIIGTPLAKEPTGRRFRNDVEKGHARAFLRAGGQRPRPPTGRQPQGRVDIRDVQMMHFFSRSEIHFTGLQTESALAGAPPRPARRSVCRGHAGWPA
jgi:signal peptidase I